MLAGSAICAEAQIAKWIVKPTYDDMEMLDCGLIKVKQDGKVGLVTAKGDSVLDIVYDSISPFNDNHALLFKGGELTDIVDTAGKLVDLSDKGYVAVPGLSYYSDGYVLIKHKGYYYFIDGEGFKTFGPYSKAYPFINGYATVTAYENFGRPGEKIYCALIAAGEGEITFPKTLRTDCSFMSSVNDHKALAVYHKKFYTADLESGRLVPIKAEPAKKLCPQVKVLGKKVEIEKTDSDQVIAVKGGSFHFDDMLRLKATEFNGETESYQIADIAKQKPSSAFTRTENGDLYGLNYNGEEFLPPQFDEVKAVKGNYAVVSHKGKCGILTIEPGVDLEFTLNNNMPAGFMHQTFPATVSVTVPSELGTTGFKVVSTSDNCEMKAEDPQIDTFAETNKLTYECELKAPKELSDSLQNFDYTFAINYDGLRGKNYTVTLPAWFVKFYEINMPSLTISATPYGVYQVEFEIQKAAFAYNDDTNYFKQVEVTSPQVSEPIAVNRVTENRFSFNVFNQDNQPMHFDVKISEAGCPAVEYPLDLNFDGAPMQAAVTPQQQAAPVQQPQNFVNQQLQYAMPVNQAAYQQQTQQPVQQQPVQQTQAQQAQQYYQQGYQQGYQQAQQQLQQQYQQQYQQVPQQYQQAYPQQYQQVPQQYQQAYPQQQYQQQYQQATYPQQTSQVVYPQQQVSPQQQAYPQQQYQQYPAQYNPYATPQQSVASR